MRNILLSVAIVLFGVILARAGQSSTSDEGGRVLALENASITPWKQRNVKALNMMLANTFLSVEIDGSVSSKSEFLASIKSPDYQPSQAVTEQSSVQVYGDAAVVVGVFRIKGTEKREALRAHENDSSTLGLSSMTLGSASLQRAH